MSAVGAAARNVDSEHAAYPRDAIERLAMVCAVVAAKAVLDWSYVTCIVPLFGRTGFPLDVSVGRVLESYVLAALAAMFLPLRSTSPGKVIAHALFLLMLVPLLSLYGLAGGSETFCVAAAFCFVLLALIVGMKNVELPSIGGGRELAVLLGVAIYVTTQVVLLRGGALQHLSFSLANVYVVREEFAADFGGALLGYLLNGTFKAIAPLLMALCAWRGRWFLFLLLAAVQVMFFGVSGHKVVLVAPVIVVCAALFLRREVRLATLTVLYAGIVAICTLVATQLGFAIPASLLVRRALFLPARLAFAYRDFFQQHGFVYGTNTVFRAFGEYPYFHGPPSLIGQAELGNNAVWANNGFLATGYMHFGVPGMFIFTAVVGALLWLMDSACGNRLPVWVVFGSTGLAALTLTNSDLSTTLITHGLLLAVLLVWLASATRRDGSVQS